MEGELIKVSGLQEALAMKSPDAAFFAGGTGIGYKDSGIHAGRLIVIPDIQGISDISEDSGYVRIGAMVTFTRALECPLVPAYLKEALRFCGSLQKRNMATVGGNVASWRCDSYLIPTLMASGAVICLKDKDGSHRIGIDEYADGRDSYADALITAVLVKAENAGDGAAHLKVISRRFANTFESHAYLTIAMGKDNGEYRIGLGVKGSGIFHPDIMNWGVSWKKADVRDDMFGTEEYKRYITSTTLEAMYEELGGEGGGES